MCDSDTRHIELINSSNFDITTEIVESDEFQDSTNLNTSDKSFTNHTNIQQDYNRSCLLSVAIRPKSKCQYSIGLCICDTLNFTFQVSEALDDEHFTVFESIILQINPDLCLISISNDLTTFKRIDQLFTTCNIKKIYQDSLMGQWSLFENSFSRLLTSTTALKGMCKEFDNYLIQLSVYKLVCYLNLTVSPFYNNKFTLAVYHIEDYLCLDRASFTVLNIFTKNGPSLYSILNNCRTFIGSRRLHRWISQPLTSIEEISHRHDIVESFSNDPCCCRDIQSQFLRKVPDLDAIVIKMRLMDSGEIVIKKRPEDVLNFEDLYRLYECILATEHLLNTILIDYIGDFKDAIINDFTKPLSEIVNNFRQFKLLVEQTLDLNQASMGVYLLNPNLHPDLKNIQEKKQIEYDRILYLKNKITKELFPEHSRMNNISNDKSKDEVIKLVDNVDYTYLFRLKRRDYLSVQSKLDKNVIEQIKLNKTEFLFTTDTLRNQCKNISKLSNHHEILQKEISSESLKVASSYWMLVEKFSGIISKLDILLGFATLVTSSIGRYVRPNMMASEGIIDLVQSRHPLVEISIDYHSFVPNDVKIDYNNRVYIITGPNMGGKSTLIRQIGLICCMAQIGSFVPCTKATLSVFKKILCRVGASDIQQRGLSTFMAEMVEASAILRAADKESLVIIDELGRGTSTFEGLGIAWAIIDHLIKSESFVLCATHFHELSNLSKEQNCVVNKNMGVTNISEDRAAINFTYSLRNGSCNLSYGINIAEIVKLPKQVIDNARIKLALLEGGTDKLNQSLKSPDFHSFCKKLSQILTFS